MVETHIVTIWPDGTTQIEVKGVKGKACKKATELIEAALGKTLSSTATPEMHQVETVKQTAKA